MALRMGNFTNVPGRFPIEVGGEVIGAGAAGGAKIEQDVEVAKAALASSCSLAGGENITRGFWVTRARNHNGADQHAQFAERRGLFGVRRSFHRPGEGRGGASDAGANCGFQAIGRAANLLPDGGDGTAKARMVLVTV
jgi:hypothetical protein